MLLTGESTDRRIRLTLEYMILIGFLDPNDFTNVTLDFTLWPPDQIDLNDFFLQQPENQQHRIAIKWDELTTKTPNTITRSVVSTPTCSYTLN